MSFRPTGEIFALLFQNKIPVGATASVARPNQPHQYNIHHRPQPVNKKRPAIKLASLLIHRFIFNHYPTIILYKLNPLLAPSFIKYSSNNSSHLASVSITVGGDAVKSSTKSVLTPLLITS